MRSRGTTVQRSVRKIVLRIAAIVLRSGTHESQVSQHVVVNLGTTYDLVTRCMRTRLYSKAGRVMDFASMREEWIDGCVFVSSVANIT